MPRVSAHQPGLCQEVLRRSTATVSRGVHVIEANGTHGYESAVRKETTAFHSRDDAPKLLLRAEPELPCLAAALDSVGFRYIMWGDQACCLFSIDKDVQMACRSMQSQDITQPAHHS